MLTSILAHAPAIATPAPPLKHAPPRAALSATAQPAWPAQSSCWRADGARGRRALSMCPTRTPPPASSSPSPAPPRLFVLRQVEGDRASPSCGPLVRRFASPPGTGAGLHYELLELLLPLPVAATAAIAVNAAAASVCAAVAAAARVHASIPRACTDPARLHRSRRLASIPHARIDPAHSHRSREIASIPSHQGSRHCVSGPPTICTYHTHQPPGNATE
jgi:hypothetical protein